LRLHSDYRKQDSQTYPLAQAYLFSVIVAAIVRLPYIARQLRSSDPTFDSVPAGICTEVLMHYSLIAATIPCLKPFVISFNTGWGQGNQGQGSSYVLESYVQKKGGHSLGMKSDNVISQSNHSQAETDLPLRPDPHAHNWSIIVDDHKTPSSRREEADGSVGSRESQQMFIRQTAAWSVRYDVDESASTVPSTEIAVAK
jgi:hypothetical protein